MLSEVKVSLENSLGGYLSNEIDRVITNFDGMINSFESHFQELKDKLNALEDKFDAYFEYMKKLQEELEVKGIQIQELKFKDGKVEALKEIIEECKHHHKETECSKPHLAEPVPATTNDIPFQSFFDLPEISSMKYDGRQVFKKDKFTTEDGIECTVEGEWLDGVPNGICIFDAEKNRGIITFTKG